VLELARFCCRTRNCKKSSPAHCRVW